MTLEFQVVSQSLDTPEFIKVVMRSWTPDTHMPPELSIYIRRNPLSMDHFAVGNLIKVDIDD